MDSTFIKVDISFIPSELLPASLAEFNGKEIILPFSLPDPDSASTGSDITKRTMDAKILFSDFEFEMVSFAIDRQYKRDLDLAVKCYRYLIEVGSVLMVVFEQLYEICTNLNDTDSLKWLKNKLKEAIASPLPHGHIDKRLRKLLSKFEDS